MISCYKTGAMYKRQSHALLYSCIHSVNIHEFLLYLKLHMVQLKGEWINWYFNCRWLWSHDSLLLEQSSVYSNNKNFLCDAPINK